MPSAPTERGTGNPLLDRSFHIGISLKGLHSLMETLVGIALLGISPEALNRIVWSIVGLELDHDPYDIFASRLTRMAESFSGNGKHFASVYLITHGAVKLALVVALWMNKLWAYPLMIVTLSVFVFYQMYRYSHTHSLAMIVLSLFDLVVIVLTWFEYRAQRSRPRPA